uniref:Polyketide cyclase / dehydrase and lipid transport, putative n=1 Tax=Theileria annulata TaxID=5874 RepID=A0A3B0MTL9_THEAN
MYKGYNILKNIKLNTNILIYKKTKLVDLPIKIIYDTIIDIPNYHKFVPWCKESNWIDELNEDIKNYRKALLTINFLLLKESYISKVSFEPYNYIKAIAYDSKIFEKLDTNWNLKKTENGTIIDFSISYQFRNPFYQHLSNTFNNSITKTMLSQFIKECYHRYNSTLIS